MKFTPSPTKVVRVINEKGELVKEVSLNRRERRRLGVRKQEVNHDRAM